MVSTVPTYPSYKVGPPSYVCWFLSPSNSVYIYIEVVFKPLLLELLEPQLSDFVATGAPLCTYCGPIVVRWPRADRLQFSFVIAEGLLYLMFTWNGNHTFIHFIHDVPIKKIKWIIWNFWLPCLIAGGGNPKRARTPRVFLIFVGVESSLPTPTWREGNPRST